MAAIPLYIPIVLGGSVTAGVHGFTTRISYTVPVGKRATLHAFNIRLFESNAKPALVAVIQLQLNGISIVSTGTSAVVNTDHRITEAWKIDLVGGDVIRVQTADGGAAGNEFYEYAMSIREYQ